MKSGSKSGRNQIKALRSKALKEKSRDGSKLILHPGSLSPGQETEVTRLTRELAESLDRETATADVLKVINSSPGDLALVFQTILEKAHRLCGVANGSLQLYDGEKFRAVAVQGISQALADRLRQGFSPGPNHPARQLLQGARFVHIPDLTEIDDPMARAATELEGTRSVLFVALRKDATLLGRIVAARLEVRPFSEKEIGLLESFAAQAVIAIENARLFGELHDRSADLARSVDELTATSDVLKTISRATVDLQTVLDTLVETAARLCHADQGFISRRRGDLYHMVASVGASEELNEYLRHNPFAAGRSTTTARAVAEARIIQVADVLADPEYASLEGPRVGGFRTVLAVPLLRGDTLVGVFSFNRISVNPFMEKEIGLITTFADQAVIAIENARLLGELRERTEQLEAQSREVANLNRQLEQRVADQVGEIERMSRLRRFLPPQVADLIVASGMEQQLESHRREIAALFCDLRGFTGFSESSDPEDVMALLREYHGAIGQIIIKYSGTLERYAGDGVMVVFNDPVPVENPALQAVLMALDMRAAIGALIDKWQRLGHDLGFGIGIAHGFATLGTIGFEGRFDYAAIGTVSNVASRLCDEAKPGQILISPRVLMAVDKAVTVEPVGEFSLKGIRRPMVAYNVLATSVSELE